MTNDKVKGKVDEAVGAGKKEVGKAIDDEEMEGEGKAQELKGKGRSVAGDLKKKAEDLKDKIT